MNATKNLLDSVNQRLFSSTYQLQRIVILAAVLLVLLLAGFGSYYYYDRYYSSQPTVQQQSVAQAEEAVRADPQNADKRFALAQAYMINGRWEDAITQAMEIRRVKADDVRVDFVLGISFANNGQPQQALQPLQKYIDSQRDQELPGLNQQYQAALYYLGDSYLQLGQPDKAVAPLTTDVNLSQTDADAIYKLGLAYSGTQDYKDALLAFEKATAFVPNYTEAYQAMAHVYDVQQKTTEASYARAMVAYSQKNYATAYPMLLQVVQNLPGFAPGFSGLGLTCEAQKNLQCALGAYQTAAKLDPNDFTATAGVQRVQTEMTK